jgi:hypothetical protein
MQRLKGPLTAQVSMGLRKCEATQAQGCATALAVRPQGLQRGPRNDQARAMRPHAGATIVIM